MSERSEAPRAGDQAVEHLQTAALEAIRAVRSFLDIAESLVREPETAATVGRAFAEAAAAAFRPSTLAGDGEGGAEREPTGEPDEPPGGVRRIDLSD